MWATGSTKRRTCLERPFAPGSRKCSRLSGCDRSSTLCRRHYREVSGAASLSPAQWPRGRRFCSSTIRRPASIRSSRPQWTTRSSSCAIWSTDFACRHASDSRCVLHRDAPGCPEGRPGGDPDCCRPEGSANGVHGAPPGSDPLERPRQRIAGVSGRLPAGVPFQDPTSLVMCARCSRRSRAGHQSTQPIPPPRTRFPPGSGAGMRTFRE